MTRTTRALAGALGMIVLAAAGPAAAQTPEPKEKYEGYYYPAPDDTEVYGPRVETLSTTGKGARAGFVTGIAKQAAEAPYAPRTVVYEKGEDSDVLIIVAIDDGILDTIYRARAVLAGMTSRARLLPVFQEVKEGREHLTFLDLCKLLGFREVVVSDGRDFAHRFLLK
jgi:hypothetical protein